MGFTPKAIAVRLRTGRLHPIHRGVYAVGHKRLSLDGHRMAAVLACGDEAALSHRDGCALHGVRQCNRRVFEVTVPRKQRPRPGIQLHYGRLPSDELTTVRGIPVTTVARSLLDLAAVCPRRDVEKAMNEAEVQRLTSPLSLAQLTERYPGHRGSRTVRVILGSLTAGDAITREAIAARLLEVVEGELLPRPSLNVWVTVGDRSHECDAVWHEQRVMVELDGYAVHGTRQRFESDRERDRLLQARGWSVVRITWRQLRDDPGGVARDLRALLANCGKARRDGAAAAR